MLTADMVKPGAVVIDVGMNRDEDGKLCGDVDFAGVKEVAGYITPVPGGVGPMTITMLLVNTIEAAERNAPLCTPLTHRCSSPRETPTNPLLDFRRCSRFDASGRNTSAPAIDDLARPHAAPRWRAWKRRLSPAFPVTWDDIVEPLEVATEQLGRAWGVVSHLNAVADTPELRAAYNAACRGDRVLDRAGADERCTPSTRRSDGPNSPCLSGAQAGTENALRNFVLGGAD